MSAISLVDIFERISELNTYILLPFSYTSYKVSLGTPYILFVIKQLDGEFLKTIDAKKATSVL